MWRVVSRESQNYHCSLLGRPIKSITRQFVRKAECQRSPQSSPESSRLRICIVKIEQHWAPNTGWDHSLSEDPQPYPVFQKPDFCQLGQGQTDGNEIFQGWESLIVFNQAGTCTASRPWILSPASVVTAVLGCVALTALPLRWFVEVSTLVLPPFPILLSKFKAGLFIFASSESWPKETIGLPVFSCAIVRRESHAFPGYSQANIVSLTWFFISYHSLSSYSWMLEIFKCEVLPRSAFQPNSDSTRKVS